MIGKVIVGKSLRGCLLYCLDKKEAQVLDHNLCGGNTKEVLQQMKEVRNLNQNVSRPVQHVTISMAKGERLSDADLVKLAEECAREMGFDKNQFVVVQHHDTEHQHIHIVINRIGFDGKTLSDSNNYKKMAQFSRKMEEKFRLRKVQNPRKFQTQAERQLPRLDSRKEKLKQDIKESLSKAKNYQDFHRLMNQRGYKLEKGRGMAFTDDKNLRIKGSELGYSLATIDKILTQKMEVKSIIIQKQTHDNEQKKKIKEGLAKKQFPGLLHKHSVNQENMLDVLTEKTDYEENINQELKKKQHQRRRLNL